MSSKVYKGRRVILSDLEKEDMLDVGKVIKLINATMETHLLNKTEIDYLIEYYKGQQEILNKTKLVRPEINNQVIINHAELITRNIVGYFIGNPIQYVSIDGNNKKEVDMLNKIVAFENKATIDKEIATYQSICGTAYRIIFSDGLYADEVPFEERSLNPSSTYVVYQNTIAETPLCAVTYYNLLDEKGIAIGYKIYCYTDFGFYEFITNSNFEIFEDAEVSFTPYSVGGVPIIEYKNNQFRIGDFELALSLMDTINDVQSGRLDDLDQIVQSLLVFINADIDADTYAEMREQGVLVLKNMTGNQSSVDNITNPLDQSGMNSFARELEDLLYNMVGIPSRNNKSGGGDTGTAVELRDGWQDLEIIARNKELEFKRSEKQALKIMLHLLNIGYNTGLTLLDIDVKFSRNKNNNLLVKAQGYMNLLTTKTLDPADALTIVDLVTDTNAFVERGMAFWEDEFAGKIPEQLKETLVDGKEMLNENEVSNNDNYSNRNLST